MSGNSLPELSTVADDEAVVHTGLSYRVYDDLKPSSNVDLDGLSVRTLPAPGELLCRFATVNDVHFGETRAGHIDGVEEFEVISSEPDDDPYPEVMSAAAVDEIAAIDPELVVVKGDLTSSGTRSELDEFLKVYDGRFGDGMIYIRGNHESFNRLEHHWLSVQERVLPGVTIALMDTSIDGGINGTFSPEQLDWLDELAERSDQPVMVFGHHPIWDASVEQRNDDVFGLLPAATESLFDVMERRRNIVGYFAGHTHRNHRVHVPGLEDRAFIEVGCVKDFPGSWAEYKVFEGGILQVHRRISTPQALRWSERARNLYGGLYEGYALGAIDERCFAMLTRD